MIKTQPNRFFKTFLLDMVKKEGVVGIIVVDSISRKRLREGDNEGNIRMTG